MKSISLPFVASADLFAAAHEAGDEVFLRLSGVADLRVVDQLADVLTAVHSKACVQRATLVSVDVTALEFMNSSCIKCFVGWLSSAQARTGGALYRVRFISNPEMLWQRSSLKAIRCMVPDLVTVETIRIGRSAPTSG